jgi:hypothetical protein
MSVLALAWASIHASSELPNVAALRNRSASLQGPSCYRLTVGPWRPALGADTAYHRLPSVIRLDTLAWDAKGRHLSPRMTYPSGASFGFPRTPRWEASGDTVRLIWSNGFTPTIVTLVRTGAILVGEAVAESDDHPVPAPPLPRATVTAEPISCDSTQLR